MQMMNLNLYIPIMASLNIGIQYFDEDLATVIIIVAAILGALFLTAIIICLYLLWKHYFTIH